MRPRIKYHILYLSTTNIIEGLNRQFCQITKNKPSFTNDDSLCRMLYLASQRITKRWCTRCQNWDLVLSQLEILFSDRAVSGSLAVECPGGQGIQPVACALSVAPLLGFVEFRLHKILHQAHNVIIAISSS